MLYLIDRLDTKNMLLKIPSMDTIKHMLNTKTHVSHLTHESNINIGLRFSTTLNKNINRDFKPLNGDKILYFEGVKIYLIDFKEEKCSE